MLVQSHRLGRTGRWALASSQGSLPGYSTGFLAAHCVLHVTKLITVAQKFPGSNKGKEN